MKAPTVMILTMGMLLCFWQGAKSHPEAEKEALEAAEVWLELVDTKKYEFCCIDRLKKNNLPIMTRD